MGSQRYIVGIDVGLYSLGLAAIEVDGIGTPTNILCMESIIHDGGVINAKNGDTRLAVSGAARRTRRLFRARRKRLQDLDRFLEDHGWPIVDLEKLRNPRAPWAARKRLADEKINDPDIQLELLSIAVRHIARHRGWRNPYQSVDSLRTVSEPSKFLNELQENISNRLNKPVDPDMTVAQLVDWADRILPSDEAYQLLPRDVAGRIKIRSADKKETSSKPGAPAGILESKIHQSDNARELRRIWDVQGLPYDLFVQIMKKVFAQKSPKSQQGGRVGKDALPGMRNQPRAEKASLAFQCFRIVSVIANLHVRDKGSTRPLSHDEKSQAFEFLCTAVDDYTWTDVAEHIGLERRQLDGTADSSNGERPSAHPPLNETNRRMLACGIKDLVNWWKEHDETDREAIIELLGNGSGSGDKSEDAEQARSRAQEFLSELPEDDLGKIDNIKLPTGRAAYSLKSLRKLTDRMLTTGDDLHEARKALFNVDDDWKPPAEPIGEPVGNPAVDRVLKLVNRFLLAATDEWGIPQSVNIELARDGLMSAKAAKDQGKENNKRYEQNRQIREEIAQGRDDSFSETADSAIDTSVSMRDVNRYRALLRQESKCLYCGSTISLEPLEMDHIVPRAGQGSTNTQVNLAAVCGPCNHSKGKIPFAVWAANKPQPGVSIEAALKRVDSFRFFGVDNRGGRNSYKERFKRQMKERLRRTDDDPEIDNRSIESVGWMANELHSRIEFHFNELNNGTERETKVGVFRGWITSEARKASGIQGGIRMLGGSRGKNRLDRRHHTLDAATIAMLRQGVASVLVVRDNLRKTFRISPDEESQKWKEFKGTDTALFDQWIEQMHQLADLIQDSLDQDRIPVWSPLRLHAGSSAVHEDTIRKMLYKKVGDAWTIGQIDRAATPQQWVALTHDPDFDIAAGLPANPQRKVRVGSQWFSVDNDLPYFPRTDRKGKLKEDQTSQDTKGCIAVRGGYAELGPSFHHARIYRCIKHSKSGKETVFYAMMRVYQVDLVPYRKKTATGKKADLFSIELPPQSISRRATFQGLRTALDTGTAEYVGWIVLGDELKLDMSSQTKDSVGELLHHFPQTTRWVVDGFPDESKLRLRPRMMSGEKITTDKEVAATDRSLTITPLKVAQIIKSGSISITQENSDKKKTIPCKGWIPSVDVVFNNCHPVIIRRDILGRPRLTSPAHLPITWQVGRITDSEE